MHTPLLSQIELRAVPKDKMFPVSCTPCRKQDFPSHLLNVFLTMKEIVLGKIFLVQVVPEVVPEYFRRLMTLFVVLL